MGTSTETLRLVISGDSHGGQKAMGDYIEKVRQGTTVSGGWSKGLALGSAQSLTFSQRVGLMRDGLGKMAKGELPQASEAFGMAASGLGAFVAIAGTSIAVVAGAVAVADKLIDKYVTLGLQLGMISRIAGTTGDESEQLRVQFRMLGIDVDSSATSLGMFSANLGKAQTLGSGPAADAFKRLGIDLKGQNGEWKTNAEVLAEARDKLSKLRTENLSAYRESSRDIFGRGYMILDKWLGASTEKIAKFKKIAESLNTNYSDGKLSGYVEDTRELSLIWEDMQATIGQQLVPLLRDDVVPALKNATKELNKIPHMSDGLSSALKAGFQPLGSALGLIGDIAGLIGSIKNTDLSGIGKSLWSGFKHYLDLLTGPMGWVLKWLAHKDGFDSGGQTATPTTSLPATNTGQATTTAQSLSWIFQGTVPGLANEGLVKASKGGTIVRLAEAGEDEVVLKASRFRGGQTGAREINITYAPSIGSLHGTSKADARRFVDETYAEFKRRLSREVRFKTAMSRG